jgi:hypothetical protein
VTHGLVLFVILLALPALLHRLARAGERRVTARRWLATEEQVEEEARRGYKTARVLVATDGSTATLAGVTLGGSYRVEDRARCRLRGCSPPAVDCDCGFYAFKKRAEALDLLRDTIPGWGLRDKALLTVDLDGDVLEYARGYRAEHQRVLSVDFEWACSGCRREGRSVRATRLAAARQFRPTPFGRPVSAGSDPAAGMWPVRPVCDDHVPLGGIPMGLGDLAGLLGTEVRWLP